MVFNFVKWISNMLQEENRSTTDKVTGDTFINTQIRWYKEGIL
jgi:hypothetical protein